MTIMTPAIDAYSTVTEDRYASKWPNREHAPCRLEPVALPFIRPGFTIARSDRVFTIGSCFARNIEEYLARLGFEVPTISFSAPASEWEGRASGILNKYTPPTIWQEIDRTLRAANAHEEEVDSILREPIVELGAGTAIDLELFGLRPVSLERAIERRRQLFALYKQVFDCEVVTITLGLVEAWFDEATGRYIQQAPTPSLLKKFPDRFFHVTLEYEEVVKSLDNAIRVLQGHGRLDKKIILTTSPVPLSRTFTGEDILIANTYAKSVLRAAAGTAAEKFKLVDYFPSYEMVMLTKDPFIWADDLIHVRDTFVAQIVSHLVQAYVPNEDLTSHREQLWTAIYSDNRESMLQLCEEQAGSPDPTIQCLRGFALVKGGKKEGLGLICESAAEAKLSSEQAMLISALLLNAGRSKICKVLIERALKAEEVATEPRGVLFARLGLILTTEGHIAEANAAVEKALVERRSVNVLNLVGRVALEQRNWSAAAEYFNESVRMLAPYPTKARNRGDAHAGLAKVALSIGDFDSAVKSLEQAKWNCPNGVMTREVERELAGVNDQSPG